MVYANDQWVQLPVRDLYDSQIMAMAINAAKDMYEKGQQEIKDFTKLYGDFYSPVPGRTEEVYNETLGKVKDVVDAIYSAGGDPLRSPEARALISRTINGVNAGKVNQYKQEALVAQEYLKNRAKAQMEGWYNEDFERAINGGKTLEEWTPTDGIWKSPAPSRFMTQDDIISPLAKAMTPEFDAVRTALANDGYDYKTVSEDRIRQMVQDNLDDLIGKSAIGKYYYDKALEAANGNEDIAKQLLVNQYVNAAKKNTKEDRELNQYKYQKMLADERMRNARQQAALEYHYKELENYDFNGNRKLDADELNYKKREMEAKIKKAFGGYDDHNIFRDADADPGVAKEYAPGTGYANKISPVDPNIVSSEDNTWYTISSEHIQDVLKDGEILSQDGKRFEPGTFSTVGDITVAPANNIIRLDGRRYNGNTVTKKMKDENGKEILVPDDRYHQYYMYARLFRSVPRLDNNGNQVKDDDGNPVYDQIPVSRDKNGSGAVLIRIKENKAVYNGKKDKKS